MKILFAQNQIFCNKSKTANVSHKSPLAPLACDTVSFGAIKKSALVGFDLACANIFKAPLETFDSTEDFKNWAKTQLDAKFNQKYEGQNIAVTAERTKILGEWNEYLNEKGNIYIDNPALSLIIFSGIVKDLNSKNQHLPPSLNKEVLSSTVKNIEKELKRNSNFQFVFN